MSLLEVKSVSKSFGGVRANQSISMTVPEGLDYRIDRAQWFR